jgi:glycerophosphoryl diester phosphodiesterase
MGQLNDTSIEVIAHRGASGYLPEHTLEAKALAYGMGADYLEQDLVVTRDDHLVVLHDIHVETVTDVAGRFPGRARDDGRFYARDFDLAELQSLNVHERRTNDGKTAVFPGRFPTDAGHFSIPSLAEELSMVRGLNKATGRNTGVYPEVKSPAWHMSEGVDISRLLMEELARFGYSEKEDPVYVQCFDATEVVRIREELGCRMKLVQLIGANSWNESDTDYDELITPEGLARVAKVADGIGPWFNHLYKLAEIDGHPVSTGVVASAKSLGLVVHPYTYRADDLPQGFESFAELIEFSIETLQVNGLFTDFPDRAVKILSRL